MSKKICILGTANLKHMTLISLYTEHFRKAEQPFDIIYLDKYHEIEEYDAQNLYRYELNINKNWSFVRKLMQYWKFKKYAIDIITREKYDFIIVWNEFTAFMFADFLRKKYCHSYCVNIRDQNFNKNPYVQYQYKKVIEKSCFSTVSSPRFVDIFPKSEYLFVHSYNEALVKELRPVEQKRDIDMPIRLMFIGRMSYPESIHKTIDALGGDKRFIIYFIGAGCDEFKDVVEKKKVDNVVIKGAFDPKDTAKLLEEADIIYSLNKENDVHSDSLLPIKLYYAIKKHIPILAYKSSYTYEYANQHNMAIGIESKDFEQLGDIIHTAYKDMSQERITVGCVMAMKDIKDSHIKLEKSIERYML